MTQDILLNIINGRGHIIENDNTMTNAEKLIRIDEIQRIVEDLYHRMDLMMEDLYED